MKTNTINNPETTTVTSTNNTSIETANTNRMYEFVFEYTPDFGSDYEHETLGPFTIEEIEDALKSVTQREEELLEEDTYDDDIRYSLSIYLRRVGDPENEIDVCGFNNDYLSEKEYAEIIDPMFPELRGIFEKVMTPGLEEGRRREAERERRKAEEERHAAEESAAALAAEKAAIETVKQYVTPERRRAAEMLVNEAKSLSDLTALQEIFPEMIIARNQNGKPADFENDPPAFLTHIFIGQWAKYSSYNPIFDWKTMRTEFICAMDFGLNIGPARTMGGRNCWWDNPDCTVFSYNGDATVYCHDGSAPFEITFSSKGGTVSWSPNLGNDAPSAKAILEELDEIIPYDRTTYRVRETESKKGNLVYSIRKGDRVYKAQISRGQVITPETDFFDLSVMNYLLPYLKADLDE